MPSAPHAARTQVLAPAPSATPPPDATPTPLALVRGVTVPLLTGTAAARRTIGAGRRGGSSHRGTAPAAGDGWWSRSARTGGPHAAPSTERRATPADQAHPPAQAHRLTSHTGRPRHTG